LKISGTINYELNDDELEDVARGVKALLQSLKALEEMNLSRVLDLLEQIDEHTKDSEEQNSKMSDLQKES
tara:strand:+ start:820 stop:1029 length:210 start_codon:yes stop_codon:yes gene_type:complete